MQIILCETGKTRSEQFRTINGSKFLLNASYEALTNLGVPTRLPYHTPRFNILFSIK